MLKKSGTFEIAQVTQEAIWISKKISAKENKTRYRVELASVGERVVSLPLDTPVEIEMPTPIKNTLSVLMAHDSSMESTHEKVSMPSDEFFEALKNNDIEKSTELLQDTAYEKYVEMPDIEIKFNWEEDENTISQTIVLKSVYMPLVPFHAVEVSVSESSFDPPTSKVVNGERIPLTPEEIEETLRQWVENAPKIKVYPGVGKLYFENLKEPENCNYTKWRKWRDSHVLQ